MNMGGYNQRMSFAENTQREYERLIARVTESDPSDARRALIHLLDTMNDPDRFVLGARLYDSHVRDLITEAYDEPRNLTQPPA